MLKVWVVGTLLVTATLARAEGFRTGSFVHPARMTGAPPIVYLNRCIGGCTITQGSEDDSRQHISSIPTVPGTHSITEFPWGDAEWNEFVVCMKQVWSPYALTLTDVQPAITEHYGEAIIAGSPGQVDVSTEFAGYSSPDQFCRPVDYAMSFTFASVFTSPQGRPTDLCRVASQEIAHEYGLDHAFQFLDGASSCSDPMTYRFDCGGQKFFRNAVAVCGEYAQRPCRCGPVQNSHTLLDSVLHAGTPTTTTSVTISSPLDGAAIAPGTTIVAPAFGQRGLTKVVFRLNGYQWGALPGAPFGPAGQLMTSYTFQLPPDVPDGVIDIEVEVRDDLDVTSLAKATVTKGAPCESADACATGQFCDTGRCIWPAPAGVTGEACTFPQFCVNEQCDTHDGQSFCSASCIPDIGDSCPMGTECVATTDRDGYCWPTSSGGGCCSGSRDTPWGPIAFAFGAIALRLRRRRL